MLLSMVRVSGKVLTYQILSNKEQCKWYPIDTIYTTVSSSQNLEFKGQLTNLLKFQSFKFDISFLSGSSSVCSLHMKFNVSTFNIDHTYQKQWCPWGLCLCVCVCVSLSLSLSSFHTLIYGFPSIYLLILLAFPFYKPFMSLPIGKKIVLGGQIPIPGL